MGLPQLQSPSRRQHAAVWNSVYFLNSADITFSRPCSPSLPSLCLSPLSLSFSLSFSVSLSLSLTSLWLQVTDQPRKEFHLLWSPKYSPRSAPSTTSLLMHESRLQGFMLNSLWCQSHAQKTHTHTHTHVTTSLCSALNAGQTFQGKRCGDRIYVRFSTCSCLKNLEQHLDRLIMNIGFHAERCI